MPTSGAVADRSARAHLFRGGRPLKRWRYVGIYGADCMLCAGVVHVAGIAQAFWAVWDRATLKEHTILLRTSAVEVGDTTVRVRDRDVAIDLALTPDGRPIDVESLHGGHPIWTRKEPVRATGEVRCGRTISIDAAGIVDESWGYHARHTAWEWSAGVGKSVTGARLTWNLVRGVHDTPVGSERAVWVDGVPAELGACSFSPNLDAVRFPEGTLRFTAEATRRRRDQLVVISSDYVQPFGAFAGSLGPGLDLAEGRGVMERHDARW